MIARLIGALALLAALAAALAAPPPAAAQTEPLQLSIDRSQVLADGGSAEIVIRLARSTAVEDSPAVTLTTDLGAFGADSGPARVVVRPEAAAGSDTLKAAITLVGDGRPGIAVVTARAGAMVDAATVTFIGAPAEIIILRPLDARPLDASRSHVVQLEVRDRLGQPVPAAPLRLEAAGAGALLRSSDGTEGALIALRTSDRGRVSATLRAPAGIVALRAVSASAEAEIQLILHGEAASLRLWVLNSVLERGSSSGSAVIVARLLDADGHPVPGQPVALTMEAASGVRLVADGDPAELITDASGAVRARAEASSARSGDYWVQAASDAAGGLRDVREITVVGAPETIYLTAARIDSLEEPQANVQEYSLLAEVVDATGRAVAMGYTVRWRLTLPGGGAALTPETSPVRGGVAIARLRLEDAVGAPSLQAWLIEAPQIDSSGLLADLAAPGLALRPGINVVTWTGAPKPIDAALAPLAHLTMTVWRPLPAGSGWQAYTTQDAPTNEVFQLQPGDRLHIRVESAARLPGVQR